MGQELFGRAAAVKVSASASASTLAGSVPLANTGTVTVSGIAGDNARRSWALSLFALFLVLFSASALATVRYDDYRGNGNVPANPQVPFYVNDLPNGTPNESPQQLQNLVEFAGATPANIASSGTSATFDWPNSADQLCRPGNTSTDSCRRWIQGRVAYAVIRFPTPGTYRFSVAHDDEVRVGFSTTFSAGNAANYRSFNYNVPVGDLGSWTANDTTYANLPGNFQITQANSCYVARVYWNNQGGNNHLRLRWTTPGNVTQIIPATQLMDPQDPASYANCANIPTDLGIEKTGPDTYVANTPFNYSIKVWNYGPVATTEVMFSDTLPASLSNISWSCAASGSAVCGPPASNVGNAYSVVTGALPVNASAGNPGTAPTSGSYLTYTVTATPANVASITNTASITVSDLNPANNTSSWTNTQTNVRVDKTGPATAVAGESFDYTLTVVNNSATATSNNVVVRDQLPPGVIATSASGASCGTFPSAPGALLTCTLAGGAIASNASRAFTLTVTAPESAGSITNYAATNPGGSGNPPSAPGALCNITTTSCASAPTTIQPKLPQLTLTKSHTGNFSVGTNGAYTLQLTNNGDGPTSGAITVVDTLPAGLGFVSGTGTDWSCSAAGQMVTCTTASIIAAGDPAPPITLTVSVGESALPSVVNAASVSGGGDPACPVEGRCNPEDPTVVTGAGELELVKIGSANGNVVGETISYSFLVTNTGNVTIDDLVVTDPLLAGPINCPVTTLAPGASTTCNADYTLTQADVDAGEVVNTATAGGKTPGDDPIDSPPSTVTTPITPAASLSLVKTGVANGNAVGDTISYSFLVTNTGNVTIDDLVVTDPLLAGPITCPVTTLAPGASTTCTADYTLTQADVDAGEVINTATAGGKTPADDPIDSPPSTVTTPITPAASLSLVKTGSANGNAVGDTIAYSFLVTNTGNVTITDLVVTDPLLAGAITCPVTTLAPGASTTCTADYTLTQADVDAGEVVNTATAGGKTPGDDPIDSPPSTVTTPITPAASLSLVKTGSANGNAVGETITYSFEVTNTGNVTIDDLVVTDPLLAGPINCPVTTLAPGASTTCTADYTLTQADVDAGEVENTATTGGKTPGDDPIDSPPSTTTTPIVGVPSLSLVKTGSANGNAVGDTIAYSFLVTNTGNVTITDLVVTDPLLAGPINCPVTTLAPGASTTCTADYTLTQADIDAGEVINTATAGGKTPADDPIDSPPSTTTTPIVGVPSLSLVKTGSANGNAVGETITYSFLVTNTGNVTIDDLVVTDPLLAGPINCPVTTLAPGASTTCTADYTLTQADVDAGEVVNTATAGGKTPGDDPIDSPPSTVTIPITPAASLSLVKTGSANGNAVGETITYSFLVTNTGNVTIDDLVVTDPLLAGPINCPVTTLAPGASTTCTADYTLTQADVDAGEVENTATAGGKTPGDDPIDSPPSTVTTPITPAASLALVKTGVANGNAVGETITYSFEVTNTGNVTIDDLVVTDPLLPGPITCPVTTLAPGASTTCTADYTLTQADVDAGEVENTATAGGKTPGDDPIDSPPSTVTTPITPAASLALVKTGVANGNAVGETITYSFLVTNTGNVTITDLVVTDPLLAGAITCPVTTLAPGASTTCTADYTLTQADVDAGEVVNTATAGGKTPGDDPIDSPPSTVTTPITPAASLALVKTGVANGNAVGDTIAYSFLVTNTGNVTIDDLVVTDPLLAGPINCPVTTLAPGASTTCTADYTLTQADVDAGEVVNTATAGGKTPGDDPIDSPPSTVTIPITPAASLSLVKTGSANGNAVGETITYSFLVTNTGNVTITDLVVTDPLLAGAITCPVTTLAPGASTTCTADYTLTQADVDAGEVVNTATAGGKTPGDDPIDSPPSTVTTPITPAASLALVKTGVANGNAVGETITYSFEVTNTGNVTIDDLVVTDPLLPGPITCPVTTLAPGASTTCTADYTLTQADVDAGEVENTATAGGKTPGDDPIDSPPSTVTTPITPAASLALVKTGVANGNAVGETITYSFLVTNTGNVTITDLVVTDPLLAGAITCPVTTLAPGASTTCTADYTLTQADVDAGEVVNTATAGGKTPGDDPIDSPPSTVTTPITPAASLSLLKTGSANGNAVGDTISYSFLVTNTGNVTIDDLVVTDPLLAVAPICPVTTLAPGASTTCTADYTLTQADIDGGEVVNTATAGGKTPGDDPIDSPPSTVTTPITPAASLSLVKTGSANGNAVGDTISYSFLVTNTGNVTIDDLVVTDPLLAVAPICPVTTLAPGASTTCTADYTLTQADIDAGEVVNTATAGGKTPGDDPIDSPPSTVTTPITPAASLSLVKTGTANGNAVGDTISYSFLVTNTGNVTIEDLVVTDPLLAGAITCPVTTLAPGASTTCTADYTLTQADIDGGEVVNTATAGGKTPGDDPIDSPPSTVTTPITPAASLSLVKTGSANGNAVGETITYSFEVTNTGNVTITDLVVTDPLLSVAPICPVTTLAPGASTTCTADYTLTQADVDAGEVENTATAGGKTPGDDPIDSPPSTVTTPITPAASLSLVKTGTANGNAVGDTISYSFLVTNTGNVTIEDLVVTDPLLAGAITCPVTTLAPGASTTCNADYTLTQADVDAGEVVNTATAGGTPPNSPPVESPPSSTTTVIEGDPSIASTKVMSGNADEDGSGSVTVGDTLTYTITATNTGNVTLTDVEITDALITPGSITCASLEPGAACVLAGSYVVTAVNADAGVVVNTALVSAGNACPVGSTAQECNPSVEVPVAKPQIDADDDSDTTPQNTPVTTPVLGNDKLNGAPINPVDVEIELLRQPEHGEVAVNPDGTITYTPDPGYSGIDTYEYQICEALNPGNCAIATVTITILPNVVEAIDDESRTEVDTPVTIPVPSNDTSTGAPLDPGSVTQVSPPSNGSISVNPDGSVVYTPNQGFTGEDSFAYRICDTSVPAAICDEATVVVTVTGEAALRLVKTASVREVKIGDLVRYTLTVENVGSANVAAASVLDTPPAGFSYVEGSLTVADGDNAGTVSGQNPLRFDGLDIAAGRNATLVYLMRVGAGVRPGSHINQAQAYAADGETPLSNIATAEVALVADAMVDDSLLLGTVFDDRDGDGWQDSATLDNVQVQGGFAGTAYVAGSTTVDRGQGPITQRDASAPMLHGISVGQISGRASEADPLEDHRVVISQRLSELAFTGDFVLTSKQGVTVRMDAAGNTTVEHQGEAAKGLTSAAPTVERRVAQVGDGYAVDYVITNTGIDERGIPGVRIASVEGLLIETDQYGRYHLAGVAGGDWARGRNFILKVDPSTLPAGAQFTTDNPLVRRITPGLPVRFDFGVKLPVEEITGGAQELEVTLEEILFAPGSAEVRDVYLPAIRELSDKLLKHDGGSLAIQTTGGFTADGEDLALARATALKALLMGPLPEDMAKKTTISVREDAADENSTLVGFKGDEVLLGTVLFDTDKSAIRPQYNALIEEVATTLEQRRGGTVVLVGHTDVRGSAAYNRALGLRRATAVYEAIAHHLSPEVRAGLRVEASNDAAAPAAGNK
ncbi:Ig-like domain-containing protein [Lysobacter sp. H23M47]|uniref:DUF7507 domain-containing protein n=1 Tax=Lysobacter sp. H23M47 TaxID=2781024 RepID=UPI0018830353|nr:Ig-like domain-containing protein [Lysobacter sp. H23M47]QOW24193.1 DUF11 domain-containing protein [Lysobacter sp. H23M47]